MSNPSFRFATKASMALCFALALACEAQAEAVKAKYEWTGAEDKFFETPGNWNENRETQLPTDELIINGNSNNGKNVTSDKEVTGSQLFLKDGAKLSVEKGGLNITENIRLGFGGDSDKENILELVEVDANQGLGQKEYDKYSEKKNLCNKRR